MLAAERGAAANTLAAYAATSPAQPRLIGDPARADRRRLARLGAALGGARARQPVARKCSALRQFYGFLVDEGLRDDDPSAALPRPRAAPAAAAAARHGEVEPLFARAEDEAGERSPARGAAAGAARAALRLGPARHRAGLAAARRRAARRAVPDRHRQGRAAAHGAGQRPAPGRRCRAGCAAARRAAAATCSPRAAASDPGTAVPAAQGAGGAGGASIRPRSARTCCATPSPPTCSRAAPTCACCRRCSATPTSPPPRSTPTSTARAAGRAGQRAPSPCGRRD